jgi:hypothetical protein
MDLMTVVGFQHVYMRGLRGSDSDSRRVSEAQAVDLMTVAGFQHVHMHGIRGSDSDGCMLKPCNSHQIHCLSL